MYHCVQSDVDLASDGVWGWESRSPACSVGSGFDGLVGLVRFLSHSEKHQSRMSTLSGMEKDPMFVSLRASAPDFQA